MGAATVFGDAWQVSDCIWGILNQDLNDASAGIPLIFEIIWIYLTKASADGVALARASNASPSLIASHMRASKAARNNPQRRDK
jgi:hypothetical protein